MSLDLTFRQKLIRVGCSAAICGLSFSFILGESVDSHAKLLREWTSDPALLPASYLPMQPVLAAIDKSTSPKWQENLVANNSLPSLPVRESLPVAGSASMLAETTIYMEPALVTVSAAAAKVETIAIVDEKEEEDPGLEPAEVEKILGSIHEATAKLALPAVKPVVSAQPQVSQSAEPKEKPAPVAKAEPAPKAQPPVALLAAAENVAPKSTKGPEHPWAIQGKIWGATAQSLGSGHFEVGLFSKIDPDGNPVGYPMPQQILPAGQTTFKLDVPAKVERGYLFAEFVAAKSGKRTLVASPANLWERGSHRLADLYFHAEDVIASVASAPSLHEVAKDTWKVQGSVATMFAQAPIPQGDVIVKVRGRKEATRTDSKGNFSLELPRLKGRLYLEVLKGGYHPTIVSLPAGDTQAIRIEIASRNAIEQIAQRLGLSQGATLGVFLGQAASGDGAGLRGLTASLSLKADGPFYFDDEGTATRDAKATSGNGRFLFLNVEAGTGFLETSLNGEAIAPVQLSSVEGGELLQKTLTPVSGGLHGRIFNPVAPGGKMQPVAGARVRVDGASDWVNSDAYGAFSIGPMKWFKGEKIQLEMSAEKFNNHRYLVKADSEGAALNLFAFPSAYVYHLARSMDVDVDTYAGLVIGKVSGPSLRIDALADQSPTNNARDFYFDAKGRLRGSHEMTDPRFGTYIIFNVPKGRALLQGNDASGTLRYSDAVYASPSSINVEME